MAKAGSALSSGLARAGGNVVKEVVVQGAPKVLSGVAGAAAAGAGGALGQALSTPRVGGGGGGTTQNADGSTNVQEITVQGGKGGATAPPVNLGGALVPALASTVAAQALSPTPLSSLPNSVDTAYSPTPAPASLADTGNTIGELVVEGQRNNGGMSGLSEGLGAILGGGGVDTLGQDVEADTLQDEEVLQEDEEGMDAKDAGLLGVLGALGLSGKDLIGMGLLGAGLLGGQGGGGGGGGGGTNPTTGLEQIATGNQQLANMLSQRAQAGMQGQIGGQGLNTIRRMVRKAQAAIRQRYSGMGMSGSTAEVADLNAAAAAGVDMQFDIGREMATTGLNAVASLTGQSANAYAALLNAQTAKNTALGNSLANFAGAVAGRFF